MSIQNYNKLEDKIDLIGYYNNSSEKIYFSFTHTTHYTNNTYSLYVNETEIDISKYIYLTSDDTSPSKLNENIEYYLKKEDFNFNNIKIDIIITSRDITLDGFGDDDGIYYYISPNYYKNNTGKYIHMINHNGVPHWEIVNNNNTVKHITKTTDYSNHPSGHIYTKITHSSIINGFSISGGSFNINYETDYTNYINS
jgi:hypothetical protein